MAKKNILLRSKIRQAEALLKQNKLYEAHKLYERVCQLDGSNAVLWSQLAILKRRIGEYTRAEYCCRKALQLSPELPLAYHALGSVFHAQNRLDEAATCYRKAIQLQSDFVEAHYYLANALRESGRVHDSVSAYYRLLQIAPDHIGGLNNLGALLSHISKYEEAIKYLSHALGINSNSVETLTNLARVYALIGSPEKAIELLEKAVAHHPTFPDAYLALATAFRQCGRHREAVENFDKVLNLKPGYRKALIGMAKTYEVMGEYERAADLIRPLLTEGTGDEILHVFYDISGHVGERERAVTLIQEVVKKEGTLDAGVASLHFRLGKHYDKNKEYDVAFENFRRGNELSRREFDFEEASKKFKAIPTIYNSEFVKTMPESRSDSKLPIFILGMPRSGTSLVEQILASHPDIHGGGELHNVRNVVDHLEACPPKKIYPEFVAVLKENDLDRIATDYEQGLAALAPAAERITDKMPHNFIYIGLILQIFPQCKIIHCRRHPLDTCLSCYFSEFGSISHNYAYDLGTLGHYYGLYSKLMAHWTRIFQGRIHEVVYEELVEDQEATSRSMLEYCGVEWSDQCLDFHKLNRIVNTISYKQVQQPMYSRSVNRWRNYDRYLEPLRDALGQSGVRY